MFHCSRSRYRTNRRTRGGGGLIYRTNRRARGGGGRKGDWPYQEKQTWPTLSIKTIETKIGCFVEQVEISSLFVFDVVN